MAPVSPAAGPYLLAIAGSPRRHGNSDRLLDAAIAGAQEAGITVRRIVASEEGVGHCRGCNACSLTGECVVHDGAQPVYRLLDGAAGLIVATPLFFAGVPGVLKDLYDRMQPYWARRYVLGEPPVAVKRPGALLIAGGGGDPFGCEAAVLTTRSVMNVLGIELLDIVFAEGVDSPTDVERHPDHLAAARALGARVAETALAQNRD